MLKNHYKYNYAMQHVFNSGKTDSYEFTQRHKYKIIIIDIIKYKEDQFD